MIGKKIKLIYLICLFFILPNNVFAVTFPNDPEIKEQYYLEQIKASSAWDMVRESPPVTVAVIDSGVDIDHPDLSDNIWHNPDEVVGDGIDNDQNGYIDDTQGWDFVLNNNDPRPKAAGNYTNVGLNHGTLIAGIIGAVGNNNFGIAGISWKIKIMPLRVMDGQGKGTTNAVYQAINYAIQKKVDIINLSIAGEFFDPLLETAITDAYNHNIAIVAAAGNETIDLNGINTTYNLNVNPRYPICQDGDRGENHVLGVGSVDDYDIKSKYSNYGSKCIDVVAPGENIFGAAYFSPVLKNYQKYFSGYWSGSSAAAAEVSGALALLKGIRPDLTNLQLYDIIKNSADNVDNKNFFYSGLLGSGRLNVFNALKMVGADYLTSFGLILSAQSNSISKVFFTDLTGSVQNSLLPYGDNFQDGINTATAELDSDGYKEIIISPGAGGISPIKIFSYAGELQKEFLAYDKNYSGGINLAIGDVDGDGQPEIITAPQSKYEPLIKIFDKNGILKKQFLAFPKNFKGGVNLSLANLNANSTWQIVATPASGFKPEVKTFDYDGRVVTDFLAYEPKYLGGVKVACLDVYADQRTEFITVPTGNHVSTARIFSSTGDLINQWSAWENSYAAGLNLTAGKDAAKNIYLAITKNQNPDGQIKLFNQLGTLLKDIKITAFTPAVALNISFK